MADAWEPGGYSRASGKGVFHNRDHVWAPGYQRRVGGTYRLGRSEIETAPQGRASWVQRRHPRQRNGWIFIEGRWR